MDDKRLARCPCCAYVDAEALALPVEFAGAAIVVEPGLADCNHFRIGSRGNQAIHVRLLPVARVGMHSYGRRYAFMVAGQAEQLREGLQFHRDAQHVHDTLGARLGNNEVRVRLDQRNVTVGINQGRHVDPGKGNGGWADQMV